MPNTRNTTRSLVSLKTLASLASVVSLVLLTSACSPQEDTAPVEEPSTTVTLSAAQEQAIGMELATVSQRSMGTSIRVNGLLEVPPQYLMSITAPFGGRVISTTTLPGTHVSKGATLAVLEDAEFITMQQEYLTASAELVFAEQELQRQQDLSADNVNARRHLERATADAAVLRVRKRALAEQLALIGINAPSLTAENLTRRIHITAPFDGYVTQVFVNSGSAVAPNGTLLELVDPTHLHVELAVFESDAAQIRDGQSMSVLISGETVQRPGHVHLVGTKIKADRTVDVHGHLDVPDDALRPGTTVTSVIHIQDSTRSAIPTDAVITADGGTWVFVRTGDHAYRRMPITIGIEEDGYSEIVNGQELLGQQIVVKGAHRLASPSGSEH